MTSEETWVLNDKFDADPNFIVTSIWLGQSIHVASVETGMEYAAESGSLVPIGLTDLSLYKTGEGEGMSPFESRWCGAGRCDLCPNWGCRNSLFSSEAEGF